MIVRFIRCWESDTVATICGCVRVKPLNSEIGAKPAWLSEAAPKKRAAAVRMAAKVFMMCPRFGGLEALGSFKTGCACSVVGGVVRSAGSAVTIVTERP